MFLVLARLVLSDVFIPFNRTSNSFIPKIDEKSMWDVVKRAGYVAVMVANSESRETDSLLDSFSGASTLFSEDGPFVFVDASQELNLTKTYMVKTPAVFLFRNHSLWFASSFPLSETSLLFMLDGFFSQKIPTIDDSKQLFSILGHFAFTLVTSPDLVEKTLDLRFKVAPFLGSMDIIVASRRLLTALEVPENEIGLFRSEDAAFTHIEIDYDSFFSSAKPVFKKLVMSDLNNPDLVTYAFISPVLRKEHEEFLYDLASQYPDLSIGYLSPPLKYLATISTLDPLDQNYHFVAFNPLFRFYYPTEHIIQSELSSMPFNSDTWFNYSSQYIKMIQNGTIQRKFHSEEEEVSSVNPIKVVGTNYAQFMNETNKDVLIYFYSSSHPDSVRDLDSFKKSVSFLESLGINDVKFGFIDAGKNSAPVLFPHIVSFPSLRYYPANNHSFSIPFFHSYTKNDIIRFFARVSKRSIDLIGIPKKDESEFKEEIGSFIKSMHSMSNNDQKVLIEYFRQMWLDLNLAVNIKAEVEETTVDAHPEEPEFVDEL